jgi:5-methylcytosine-specific restriction enzyme subunit McrC
MLAYCSVTGLDRGHLVYAKGNEVAMSHDVRRAGVRIVQHTLDLDQEPVALLEQVDRLAERIAAPILRSLGAAR